MKQQGLFKVRDLRKKTQFKIDDEYINGWARFCGANATLVYTSLCRHAEFYSQKAFPSQKKIAFELGISIASVKRGIKQLVEYNIIKIEKEKMRGKFDNNLYYLLDKSEWIKPTIAPQEPRLNRSSKTVAHRPYTVRDTLKDNKELRIQIKKDNKENAKASFASLDDFINKCKNSPQRHIQIIGEWAEGERPSYNTGAQWDRYLKRNLRAARELTPFSAEELQKAYIRLQGDVVKVDEETGKKVGFLSKYTLETLAKYI